MFAQCLTVDVFALAFMLLIWLTSFLEIGEVARFHLTDADTHRHLVWVVIFRHDWDRSQVSWTTHPVIDARGTYQYLLAHPFGSASVSESHHSDSDESAL